MTNRGSSREHLLAAFLLFGLTTVIATTLLLIALIVWLSEVTGSVIIATTLIGGFCAVLASVIYLLAIRDAMAQLHEKFDTILQVAQAAQIGYKWLTEKILLFLKPQ